MFQISEKYFIGFIIGLISTNIIGSVIIPAHFVLDAPTIDIGYGVLGSKLIMSHTMAIMGIWYGTLGSFTLGSMIHVFVILSIISIPITIKLSNGIKIHKRILYMYLIHIEIMTLFTWWWIPNFGFS